MTKLAGSTVVFSLVIIVVMLSFVLGLVRVFPEDIFRLKKNQERAAALYAAWAGVEHGLTMLSYARTHGEYATTDSDAVYEPRMEKRTCSENSASCLNFQSMLGGLKNNTPLRGTLDKDLTYELSVTHAIRQLGNDTDVRDQVQMPFFQERAHWINRNGIFRAQSQFAFDARGVHEGVVLRGTVLDIPLCQGVQSVRVQAVWKDSSGLVLTETTSELKNSQDFTEVAIPYPKTVTRPRLLELRFSLPWDKAECFGRFALTPASHDSVDLGFDVIDVVGKKNTTSHRLQVLVGRTNNTVLGIYEF